MYYLYIYLPIEICASSCRNISKAKNKEGGGGVTMQYTPTKNKISEETWSILQTAWLNSSKMEQVTVSGEGGWVVPVKYGSWKE